MVRTSLFLSVVIVVALGMWLLGELAFLSPHRTMILHRYGALIAEFAGVFTLNLFGGILTLNRRLFLRDTGRKLAHVEKQLRTGSSISDELTDRLAE